MRRKAVVSMGVCALISSAAAPLVSAGELPQIASTSLCGDGYLLALAPERAAALSWQSRDAVSRANAAQRRLPQIWDDPEQVINMPADVILFGPGEGGTASRFLSKTSKATHSIKWGESFQSVKENYAKSGTALMMENRSKDLINDLEARLRGLEARTRRRAKTAKVLYLSRAGGTAGRQTYVDAAITAAGGQNVIQTTGWLTLSPENLLALNPDIVITSFMEEGYESVNASGLRHKTLRKFIDERPQLNVPGALWPCAGPGLIETAEMIADGLDGLE